MEDRARYIIEERMKRKQRKHQRHLGGYNADIEATATSSDDDLSSSPYPTSTSPSLSPSTPFFQPKPELTSSASSSDSSSSSTFSPPTQYRFYTNVLPKSRMRRRRKNKKKKNNTKKTKIHPGIDLSLVNLMTSSEFDDYLVTAGYRTTTTSTTPISSCANTPSPPPPPPPPAQPVTSTAKSNVNTIPSPPSAILPVEITPASSSFTPMHRTLATLSQQPSLSSSLPPVKKEEENNDLLSMSTCSVTLEEALLFSPYPRFIIEAESPHVVVHANAAYGNLFSASSSSSVSFRNGTMNSGKQQLLKRDKSHQCHEASVALPHTPSSMSFRTVVGKALTTYTEDTSSPTLLSSSINTTCNGALSASLAPEEEDSLRKISSENTGGSKRKLMMVSEPSLCSEPSSTEDNHVDVGDDGNNEEDYILDTVLCHLKLFFSPKNANGDDQDERDFCDVKLGHKRRKIVTGATENTAVPENTSGRACNSTDFSVGRDYTRNAEGVMKYCSSQWSTPPSLPSTMSSMMRSSSALPYERVVVYPVRSDRSHRQDFNYTGRRAPSFVSATAIKEDTSSSSSIKPQQTISCSVSSLSTFFSQSPSPNTTHYLVQMEPSNMHDPTSSPFKGSTSSSLMEGMHAVG